MQKRIFVFLLFFSFVVFLFSSEFSFNLNDINIGKEILKGNNTYLNVEIPDISLAYLNKKELRLLRNQIYAKYNAKFNSSDLSEYFNKQDWYVPLCNTIEAEKKFNYIDKLNISKIQQYEKCVTKNPIEEKDYIKVWQCERDNLGEGFIDYFLFKDNMNFCFGFSNKLFFSGTFILYDNCIELTITNYAKEYYDNSYLEKLCPFSLCFPFEKCELHSETYDKYNNQQFVIQIGNTYLYSFDTRYLDE